MEKAKREYAFFPVYLTYFLGNFGLAIIYPIFTPILLLPNQPFSLESSYILRTITLGMLIGVFPLAQLIGAPILGQFSDRYGRKRAFLITILGTALGYTFTAIGLVLHALPLIFLSRFMTGLFASNLTLCLSAIVDMSPDEKARARNFGHIAAIGGLSFIVAIAMAGTLSDSHFGKYFNPSFPFWVTAVLAYVNLICMILLFKETHLTGKHLDLHSFKGIYNIKFALKNEKLRMIYLGNFFFMLSWVASMQFLPAFLIKHFSYKNLPITVTLVFVGLIWSLSNFVINRQLAKRFCPAKTLNVCLLFLALLLFGVLFTKNSFAFFLLFYPAVCLASLCWTNSLANISLKASTAVQGSILGINQSMTSLAAMIAPVLGGVFAGGGKVWMFSFTGICSLLAFLILRQANHKFSDTKS